jgi:pimeloyl-ACP methyl ester carboxylesterase
VARRRYSVGAYSNKYTSDIANPIEPTEAIPSGSKRIILCCHGYGGSGWSYAPAQPPGQHVTALANAGYALLPVDHARINSWGDPDSMRALDDAYTYATTTLGYSNTKVGLMGYSMGGLAALNWLKRNPSKVSCAWLWAPATDLRFFRDNSGAYTPTYNTGGITQGAFTTEINSTFAPTNTASGSATIPALGGGGVTVNLTAFSANNVYADADNSANVGLPQLTHVTSGVAFTYTGKTDTSLTGCVSTTGGSISVTNGQSITGNYTGQSKGYIPWNEAAYIGGLGVKIQVCQPTDDATVPPEMNTHASAGFVARAANANVTLRTTTGGHTAHFNNVPTSEVVAWYAARL